MNSRANGRLALIIAATVAYAAFATKPLYACDSTRGCPSNTANLDGLAANALPTYPEAAAETPAEPVRLKRFTRSQSRSARRAQSRKATLAQRAQGSKVAKARQAEDEAAEARGKGPTKVAFANANAEFMDSNAGKSSSSETTPSPDKTSPADQAATAASGGKQAQTAATEVVAADQFNDLDRVAWQGNQMPRLMQLTDSNARAELRDDDSRWAQTSTIGKLFVAFGALLTIGSAIRMFLA